METDIEMSEVNETTDNPLVGRASNSLLQPVADSEVPAQDRRFEGWMDKYSDARGKGWQGRFFVLEQNILAYYKTKDAQTMFDECDADRSGYLERGEIKYLCEQMGMKIDEWSLDQAMGVMDRDNSGHVDFAEFAPWWRENADKKALKKQEAAGKIDMKTCIRIEVSHGHGTKDNIGAVGKMELLLQTSNKGNKKYRLRPSSDADKWHVLLQSTMSSLQARHRLGLVGEGSHPSATVWASGVRAGMRLLLVAADLPPADLPGLLHEGLESEVARVKRRARKIIFRCFIIVGALTGGIVVYIVDQILATPAHPWFKGVVNVDGHQNGIVDVVYGVLVGGLLGLGLYILFILPNVNKGSRRLSKALEGRDYVPLPRTRGWGPTA
jgi:hypothetical protein